MSKRQLIVIVGPTAVGKTALCVKLAKHFGCEIISADSRQFYREIGIGTARPTTEEMDGTVHHFVGDRSVTQLYSAGDFERDVLVLLDKLFKKSSRVILTGGSGLFIKAVTHGLDNLPGTPSALRQELMTRLATDGLTALAGELQRLDPVYHASMDVSNAQRVVRALEVCLHTGQPFSTFHKSEPVRRNVDFIKIGLERPRQQLYERINQRVDVMLRDGLVKEAKSVAEFRGLNALQTVGYREVYQFLAGELDEETMRAMIQQNTRRFAKRQLTWFKNQDTFTWFHPDDVAKIVQFIDGQSSHGRSS